VKIVRNVDHDATALANIHGRLPFDDAISQEAEK